MNSKCSAKIRKKGMDGLKAKILKSSGREFDCLLLDSKERVKAVAKGNLHKQHDLVVGDNVEIEQMEDCWQITSLLERENIIDRYIVRERKKKTIAANIDTIVLVMTVSKPDYKQGLVDRYLIRSQIWDIPLVLVLNKIDEPVSDGLDLKFECERLKNLAEDIFEISAKVPNTDSKHVPENKNFEELKNYLKGKTALFVGQSGVGKSKTISALSGGKEILLSKEIGKVGKGAHTTTWAEIVDCGDFYLVDSPGIRSFSLEDIFVEDLEVYFPDLFAHFSKCKFKDCNHKQEQKHCYFNSLSKDVLEEKILISRLHSFQRIEQELEKTPTWKKRKRN